MEVVEDILKEFNFMCYGVDETVLIHHTFYPVHACLRTMDSVKGEWCMLNQTQHTEGNVLVCTVARLAHSRRNSLLSSAFMQ